MASTLCFFIGLFFSLAQTQNTLFLSVDHRYPDQHGTVLGIDPLTRPRISWTFGSYCRQQQEYSLIIEDETNPDFVWATGPVKSPQSTSVVYTGKPLQSATTYSVSLVASCDSKKFSGRVRFHTGLRHEDFSAPFIGSNQINMNQIRKDFQVNSGLRQAIVTICGVGYYELFFNGLNVDETRKLDPGWTTFETRLLYTTFNVTRLLRPGTNAVGVALGNGWYSQDQYAPPSIAKEAYGPPRFTFQLTLSYISGSDVVIKSDTTWKGREGHIIRDSVYHGEFVDLRKKNMNWTKPNFTDPLSLWIAPSVLPSPGGVLSPQIMEPIRITQELPALSVKDTSNSIYVVDFGQNFAGWVRIKTKGPRGSTVRVQYAEILEHPTNKSSIYTDVIYIDNLRSAEASDIFVLSGGEEYLETTFTVHGFRYIQIYHPFKAPTVFNITGLVVHSHAPIIGNFSTSSFVLNQIQNAVQWGQRSNLMSLPTDCPQRDERKGWLGDSALTVDEAMFNFELPAFYENWAQNMRDAQTFEGAVPDTVPLSFGSSPADPNWGTAYPTTIFYHYNHYGDKSFVANHYYHIKAWVDMLTFEVSKTGLDKMYSHYGDWVPPPPHPKTSSHLCSAAAYAIDARNLAYLAGVIGNTFDEDFYNDLADQIASSFHSAFYSSAKGGYDDNSQSANVLALYIGAVPPNLTKIVQNSLLDDIKTNKDHLTTGIIGTRYLFPVLSQIGHHDLAIKIATQTTYPSYGYMFNNPNEPATTFWELWNTDADGPGMDSRNHIMFGSIGSWFYRDIAGINPNSLETVIIAPRPVRDPASPLTSAFTTHKTAKGLIQSNWKITQSSYILEGQIPHNTKGKVVIPFLNSKYTQLRLNGHVIDQFPGRKKISLEQFSPEDVVSTIELLEDGSIQAMCDAGSFHFEATF